MSAGRKPPYKGAARSGGTGARRSLIEVSYQVKGDPTRAQRDRPAPPVGSRARPVTGLRIDGATAFGVMTDRTKWQPRFRALVDRLRLLQHERATAEVGQAPDDELDDMKLPLPRLPSDPQRGLAGVLLDDGEGSVDWSSRGFGGLYGGPVAQVGVDGRSITFYFRDRAFVRLMRRVDKDNRVGWYIRVEAKHRELYGRGTWEWLRTWLGYFSWLTGGGWLEPHQLESFGWRTTQMHLNVDYCGIYFQWEDTLDFTAARKRSMWGRQFPQDDEDDDADDDVLDGLDVEALELDDDDENDEEDDDALSHRHGNVQYEAPVGFMQTFQVGRRASDVMMVGYRKGDEQRESQGIDPAASDYAAHWRAHAWDPVLDGDPFRVELRLRKKGLIYRHAERDEIAFDFRNPALLADESALRTLWTAITTRRRLVDRTGTRVRRCPTDPRWLVVQSVSSRPDNVDIRQIPHEVAKLTREERIAKSQRKLFDAVQDAALNEHGVGLVDALDFAAAFRVLANRLQRGEIDVHDLGAGTLANPWRASKALKRKPAMVQFFADELGERVEPYQAELRGHGGLGGIPLEELLPIDQGEENGEHQSSRTVGEPRSGPGP